NPRQLRESRAALRSIVDELIARRRASRVKGDDVLQVLCDAGSSGADDDQARDDALTLMLAGHDTIATALSWTLYLLAMDADGADRVAGEIESTYGTAPPAADGFRRLPYLSRVFTESLRLYPP